MSAAKNRKTPKREYLDFEEFMLHGGINRNGIRKKRTPIYSKALQAKISNVVNNVFNELNSSQVMNKRD